VILRTLFNIVIQDKNIHAVSFVRKSESIKTVAR
jgi:hypothetical protein